MWQNELEFRRCFPEFAKVFQSDRRVFKTRHCAFLREGPLWVAVGQPRMDFIALTTGNGHKWTFTRRRQKAGASWIFRSVLGGAGYADQAVQNAR